MKKLINLSCALCACLHVTSQVETLINADLRNVLVYTNAAELYFEKDVELKKGKNTIVFAYLTPYIIENSVNVSVAGAADILTVNERINYTREKNINNAQVNSYKDSLKYLKKEIGLLRCRLDVVEKEKELLFKNDAIAGFSNNSVPIAEIEKASAFYNKRLYELNKEIFSLKERETELSQSIIRYDNQVRETQTASTLTSSEIKLTVQSQSVQTLKFSLRFLTAKASWAPVYDFKYEGPAKPLQFAYRANISNATGNSWNDVQVKLSTANPLNSFSLPGVNSNNTYSQQGVKFRQVEVTNSIVEYTVPHEYTIPSDGKPYLVDVKTFEMKADYNYLLIPRLDPFGFLMAKVYDWNKYNLIPGQANIYNMGTYMGKTYLNSFAENDTMSLYLGKDRNIQAVREETTEKHENSFAGNFVAEETKVKMSIRNNLNESLKVEVLDVVPVPDDDEKLNIDGVETAIYSREEGKLNWNIMLEGGGAFNLNYSYVWKTPKAIRGHNNYKPRHKKFRSVSCPTF